MKEDIYIIDRGRVRFVKSRPATPFERDPDKFWLGNSQWHLDLTNFTLTHEGEGICTAYAVDPSALIHTSLLSLGEKTDEGHLVNSPTATWFEISRQLETNPAFRFEFCAVPEKFEQFIAGAYRAENWSQVTLTPRSGDRGRDVIAQLNATFEFNQAKAYSAQNLVSQNDVRAMYGVLYLDPKATRAVVTTTSDFAPGVANEFSGVMPHELETKNGVQFVEWATNASKTELAERVRRKLLVGAGIRIEKSPSGHVDVRRSTRPTWRDLCGEYFA